MDVDFEEHTPVEKKVGGVWESTGGVELEKKGLDAAYATFKF